MRKRDAKEVGVIQIWIGSINCSGFTRWVLERSEISRYARRIRGECPTLTGFGLGHRRRTTEEVVMRDEPT